jgi:hypothetical protein
MIAAAGMLAVVALLAAPHALRLDAAPPMATAVTWLAALALRATIGAVAAVLAVLVVPSTAGFHAATCWCWEAHAPVGPATTGVSGHVIGAAALAVPGLLIATSLAWTAVGVRRATRAVQRLVRSGLAGGPDGSVIVRDGCVFIAAAGLRDPRVVVSAGALTELDDAELRAGLRHEQGHIRRRHRWLLLAGEVFRVLGRPFPGTDRAVRELTFHLERDADQYAVACAHDRLALAGAICKAAGAEPAPRATALADGGSARRVTQLLHPPRCRPPAVRVRILAAGLVAASLCLVAALPLAASAVPGGPRTATAHGHCTAR